MADHAPGYDRAAEDLQCYNCGMKGHLFFACPEETRRVPAGLEASRKRQASGNDYPAPVKRTKGPVVTHYPPPPPPGLPHISPPPTTYSPRPGYDHSGPPPGPPPGPPYHHPPHPGPYDRYPPLNTGRNASGGFPYSNSRDVYEHHFQALPRAPPPEPPHRPPYFDQYDQYRLGSSPNAHYSRPYSAPPDRYDEHFSSLPQGHPLAATHRTHQAHFEHYPPAPGVDNYYPHPPQSYPPPYPPHPGVYRNSSHYRYDGTSPTRPYTSGHGSPPPGTHSYSPHPYPPSDPPPYHVRYDERFADQPSYDTRGGDIRPQRAGPYSSENRHNNERHGRRMRYDSPKHRSRSERRFLDRPPRNHSPENSTPSAQSAKGSVAPEDSKPPHGSSDAVLATTKSEEEYNAEDLSWEEEMIFKEIPMKITKDLIREPLPVEWTDDAIIPPKYDKETITSKYINPTNVDDFALSIRETKAWQVMQYHPTFLPPTDVRIESLRDYERALNPGPSYNKQNRHNINSGGGGSGSGRQRGKSWSARARGVRQSRHVQHQGQNLVSNDDQFDYSRSGPRKRSWDDDTSYRGAEEREGEDGISGKDTKISSPEPGEVYETDDQHPTSATKMASLSWEREHNHTRQNRRDSIMSSLQDPRVRLPDVLSEGDTRQPFRRATSTPPPPSPLSGSPSRPHSRRSSQASSSRPASQRSLKSHPSQPSSRRSSVGSPLTPNERELLGMRPYSSGSDTGRDSPIPQANNVSTRSRQRPAKLHAAYQRRW